MAFSPGKATHKIFVHFLNLNMLLTFYLFIYLFKTDTLQITNEKKCSIRFCTIESAVHTFNLEASWMPASFTVVFDAAGLNSE